MRIRYVVFSQMVMFFLLFGSILFTCNTAFGYDDKTEVSLKKAAVYAASYDDKGKIASVTLLSYEGEDYIVTDDDIGKKLIPLVEHVVDVSGIITLDAKGRKVITVSKFTEAFN